MFTTRSSRSVNTSARHRTQVASRIRGKFLNKGNQPIKHLKYGKVQRIAKLIQQFLMV